MRRRAALSQKASQSSGTWSRFVSLLFDRRSDAWSSIDRDGRHTRSTRATRQIRKPTLDAFRTSSRRPELPFGRRLTSPPGRLHRPAGTRFPRRAPRQGRHLPERRPERALSPFTPRNAGQRRADSPQSIDCSTLGKPVSEPLPRGLRAPHKLAVILSRFFLRNPGSTRRGQRPKPRAGSCCLGPAGPRTTKVRASTMRVVSGRTVSHRT